MSERFGHLHKHDVQVSKVQNYQLYQIAGEPTLKLAPATAANKPYYNALLKRMRRTQRLLRFGSLTAAVIEETRDDDRKLYAEHVVKGWDNVVDSEEEAAPFSREACSDFLAALPDWIFDEVRTFAADAANFTDDEVDDIEGIAGNS